MKLNLFVLIVLLIFACNSCSGQSKPTDKVQQTESENKEVSLFLKYKTGIRAILEDSKGNIWFGSHNEGVCKFDGKTFTYFTTANGLSDNQVRSIYEDKNGIIWFECGVGLSSHDGQIITSHLKKNHDFLQQSVVTKYNAKKSWALSESDLWFKGNESTGFNQIEGQAGVYRYDGNELNYLDFPVQPEKDSGNIYSISTPFIKGENGKLWLGTYGAVIGYDGSAFDIIDNERLGFTQETGFLHVRSLFEDSKGNLWIGNNGIGVLKFDGSSIINFTKKYSLTKFDTKGNSLEKVFSIGEDKSGNMWFGTSYHSGVWQFDGKSLTNFTEKNGIASEQIWTIYTSKQDEMWFGGANPSGVYKFNGDSFERKY